MFFLVVAMAMLAFTTKYKSLLVSHASDIFGDVQSARTTPSLLDLRERRGLTSRGVRSFTSPDPGTRTKEATASTPRGCRSLAGSRLLTHVKLFPTRAIYYCNPPRKNKRLCIFRVDTPPTLQEATQKPFPIFTTTVISHTWVKRKFTTGTIIRIA